MNLSELGKQWIALCVELDRLWNLEGKVTIRIKSLEDEKENLWNRFIKARDSKLRRN